MFSRRVPHKNSSASEGPDVHVSSQKLETLPCGKRESARFLVLVDLPILLYMHFN